MAGAPARSVVLSDARGGDHSLRVTWHPALGVVVFSHWSGGVCTASTRVAVADAADLVDLLAALPTHPDGGARPAPHSRQVVG